VGPFDVADAPELADLDVAAALVAPAAAAGQIFSVLELDAQQAIDLGHGKKIDVRHEDADVVAAVAPDGRLVGLAAVQDGSARTVVNFPSENADPAVVEARHGQSGRDEQETR
jgi:tRNA pseudouridine55 synthase